MVDSIIGEHNVSGRSSAYGDNIPETLVGGRGETNSNNFQVRCSVRRVTTFIARASFCFYVN